MSMESRKFEAAGMMEAVSAVRFHQYNFVDGHENANLPPVTSTFLPRGQAMKGQMHSFRHNFTPDCDVYGKYGCKELLLACKSSMRVQASRHARQCWQRRRYVGSAPMSKWLASTSQSVTKRGCVAWAPTWAAMVTKCGTCAPAMICWNC